MVHQVISVSEMSLFKQDPSKTRTNLLLAPAAFPRVIVPGGQEQDPVLFILYADHVNSVSI